MGNGQKNDFQNGGRPPCWILKICSFCHVAPVDLPFCFLIQNVMAKKRFLRWRPPLSPLHFAVINGATKLKFGTLVGIQNFDEIGQSVNG